MINTVCVIMCLSLVVVVVSYYNNNIIIILIIIYLYQSITIPYQKSRNGVTACIGNGQFTDSPGPLTTQPQAGRSIKVVIATCNDILSI